MCVPLVTFRFAYSPLPRPLLAGSRAAVERPDEMTVRIPSAECRRHRPVDYRQGRVRQIHKGRACKPIRPSGRQRPHPQAAAPHTVPETSGPRLTAERSAWTAHLMTSVICPRTQPHRRRRLGSSLTTPPGYRITAAESAHPKSAKPLGESALAAPAILQSACAR